MNGRGLSVRQIHELPPEKLKQREVVMIDIANDPVSSSDYKPDEDPTKFHSVKTGRGPLVGKWQQQVGDGCAGARGICIGNVESMCRK